MPAHDGHRASDDPGKGFLDSFHDKVVYQVYPRSFRDSTGNGVGDLRGVIEKVPHIASLGVDLVWLNPFFPSPGRDNGYDVSDYRAVDPAMGTMEDLEELVEALGDHGVGVMVDMVLNHTSTEHEWFRRALAGERRYQDYYILRPAKEDGSLPTNWVSKFGGPAWAPFGDTGLYYLHLFDPGQADLNWRNPEVRAEAADIINFWRGKGVRGFRFDVINLIGKKEDLLDAPPGTDDRTMYTDGPDVHTYLRELAAASFGHDPGTVTVGEMSSTTISACVGYSDPANAELDMVFSFHHLKVDYADGQKWTTMDLDLAALKRVLNDWATGMQAGGGWNALFWNNHDQPRAVNRFADPRRYPAESATMLATVIHLMRGTPYVYMGEEIGMTDPAYTSVADYVDVEALNAYEELLAQGSGEREAFAVVHAKARDNARTPMQWEPGPGAGFTSGTPWLRPTNQDQVNVEAEERQGRILPYYRRLIALRKQYQVVSEGTYEPYALDHPDVLAYQRHHEGQHLLVLCSFRGRDTRIDVPARYARGQVFVSNYPDGYPGGGDGAQPPEGLGDLPAGDGDRRADQPGPGSQPDRAVSARVPVRLRPYEALALLCAEPASGS